MLMTQEHRKKIDEIITGMHCPHDFRCYKSKFKKLSRIRMLVDGEVIECLEDKLCLCEHAMSFGDSYLCICPLRKYVAKHFGR
jgi:hypothetical protein